MKIKYRNRGLLKSLLFTILALCASVSFAEKKYAFNADWRFIKEDVEHGETLTLDDARWQPVSLPHTYNDVDTFDDWSPQGHMGEMNQWGGKTWYRKHFDVPAEWNGKSIIIEFEAVRQVADIYCNGVKVGRCENGFVPFGADISSHLKYGEKNIIAVSCDNTFVKDTEGNRKEIWHTYSGGAKFPWNNPHWHPAHGGIYRNAFLHVSDKLHLTQPLYNNMKTVGTYVYAINPTRETTGVGVEAEVANTTDSTQTFEVRSKLVNVAGNVVMTIAKEVALNAGERAIIKNQGTLDNPQLWEPGYPYLYTLATELVRDGAVVDSNTVPFGVRWIALSTESGFSINDRHIKLQGWGMKSVDGWPGLGAANPDWMHYYTLKMISDCGGNFVRWGHTCGAPIDLRSSDQLGIITMQPGVDGEGDTEGHAWDIRLSVWREVVVYFRNNPSLIVWEGGNQSTSKSHVAELKEVVTTYDPYGGRVYGHRRANNVVEPYCDLTISTEGSGYIKSLPTIEGEYNREESPRRVWDHHTPPYQNWHANGSYDLTAEEFAINQLFQYEKIAAPSHGGGANWIFVDSTSGGRVDTEVTRTSGELDAMRLPKEAYHACRVIFTDEPDIHLIGHWNYNTQTVKEINVIADCNEVRLSLNGKELGRKKAAEMVMKKSKDSPRSHPLLFTFPELEWEPGTLLAIGYKDGKEIARDELITTGKAVALRLTPFTGPTGLLADGSDVVVFDVEAVDKDGNRVPTYIDRCDFEMQGPGVWRGGYNSGKIKSTNNRYLDLECGVNRVIIRSTREAGDITLTASAEGLKPATVTVQSKPLPAQGGITQQLPAIPKQDELTPLPLPENTQRPMTSKNADESLSSALLENVSYSGPSADVRIKEIGKDRLMYTDHAQKMPTLPSFIAGGQYIQMPNSEWNYSAVDLLQFTVRSNATVYVAHDAKIAEKMEWLTDDFKNTGTALKAGKHTWQLFSKKAKAGESILMGSNTESTGNKCWMMVVFVVPE